MHFSSSALIPLSLAATAAQAVPTIAQMRHERRVVIVASPRADDPRLLEQRRLLAAWTQGANDRDVSVVEVIGQAVHGAGDPGGPTRRRWNLPRASFTVIVVGKDGHEALRSHKPLSGDLLAARIDAMPMRRAGNR